VAAPWKSPHDVVAAAGLQLDSRRTARADILSAMQFLVHGVDRATGQDTTMPVKADNAAQAESIASLSMLVAEITPDATVAAPTVAYARVATTPADVDWSKGIVRQARVLRGLSWVVAGTGVLGLLLIGVTELDELTNNIAIHALIDALQIIAPHADISVVVWIFVTACGMRLAAHVILGIRELLIQKIDRGDRS
jgi:hypothetical protein